MICALRKREEETIFCCGGRDSNSSLSIQKVANPVICKQKALICFCRQAAENTLLPRVRTYLVSTILVASLAATAAPTFVAPALGLIRITDNYTFTNLQPNQGGLSKLYSSTDAMFPYLSSMDPANVPVCVGYVPQSGQGQCVIVYNNGQGSGTGAGSWYCIWVNAGTTTINTLQGTCTAYYS